MKINKIHIVFVWAFLFSFFCLKKGNAQVIEVNRNLEHRNISSEVWVWSDTTCAMTIDEIKEKDTNAFLLTQNGNNDFFHFNQIRACPWVHFKIVNTDLKALRFYLNVDNHRISRVNWYTYNKGKKIDEIITGDNLKFSHRRVKHLNYLMPIQVAPNDTLDCYLNMYRGTNIIFTNLTLQTSKDFIAQNSVEKYKIGILVGVSFFFVVIGFVGLLLFRTRLLCYYFLMVFSMFIWCLAGEGIGYQYFWGESSKLLNRIIVVGVPVVQLFSFLLFGMTFFETKDLHPKIHQWMRRVFGFIFFLTICGIPTLIVMKDSFEWYKSISLLLIYLLHSTIIFAYVLILILGIKDFLIKKTFESVAFIAVMIVYLIFVISMLLQTNGVILHWSILKYSFFPGFIFEMIVLTFIIFKKYKYDNEEKEKLQIAYNRNQTLTANKLLEGEELERQRIASDLHDSLGSLLSISKLYISQIAFSEKEKVITIIEKAQQTTRRISNSLMPKALFSIGLIPAINDLCENLEKEYDVKINLVNNDLVFAYSDFQKINIYRLVETLLSVTIAELEAKTISFQLTEFDAELNLIMEDDGIQRTTLTEGLLTRIESLKGEFYLDQNPLHGNNMVIDLQLD